MPADEGYSETKEKSREKSVAVTAMFYTLMVILVPMVSYSASKKYLFDGFFGMNDSTGTTAAAIFAVVSVHIVLVFFIIAAFKEDKRPPMTKLE